MEGYYRLGKSYYGSKIWLSSDKYPYDFNDLIAELVCRDIREKTGIKCDKLHELTSILKSLNGIDLAGRPGLTEKILKVKIEIRIDAQLVENKIVSEEVETK
mgnify:CR=1 FL=1